MRQKILSFALILHLAGAVQAGDDFMAGFQMPEVSEPIIPKLSAKVTDFGAVPDGRTLNTAAIAKGIAELSKQGGGRLVFPPGIWLTGPIELKSRIELHLEEGSLVLFSRVHEDFPPHEWNVKGEKFTKATSPLWGENVEDVAITGRGVVDGNGDAWRPVKKAKMTEGQWKKLLASGGAVDENDKIWRPSVKSDKQRPNLLKIVGGKRLLLEGVTFQNSPGWNLNPTLCEDLTIRNVNVRNPWYSQNGDGLDVEHCRDVIIRDSRFDVGDDGICLKSGKDEEGRRIGAPTENVLIENCVVYHAHGGVTIGSEMSSGVRNVRVENCTFIGTDLGLRFKSTRGRGGVVEKIFINNVRMTDIATDAIGFNLYYGGQSPEDRAEGAGSPKANAIVNEGTPQFRDVFIQNVTCRGARTAVVLQGLPEMPIRGIHLRDISITAEQGMVCTDARDITFDRVQILNRQGPAITLTDSRDFRIDHLECKPGVDVFFALHGTNNANISLKNTDLKAAAQDIRLSQGAERRAIVVQ